MTDIKKEKRDKATLDRLADLEKLFKLAVYEECFALQPGNSIIPDERLRKITESRRFMPHFFHCFPWCAAVVPDKDGLLSIDEIKISRINSYHLLESRKEFFRSEGYHIEDLSEGENLGFPVNNGDEWILQDNICEWCGGPFADDLSPREKGKRIFCCDDCKKKYRNFDRIYSQKKESGELTVNFQFLHALRVPGIELARMLRDPCLNCGNIIPDDKPLTAKFCCNQCRYEHNNKKRKKSG